MFLPHHLQLINGRVWDGLQEKFINRKLVEAAITPREHSTLHAADTKESGALLNAPPSTSLGLRLEDEVVRISVGLHLGSSLSFPHQCCLCGTGVDAFATHGLSCIKREGRYSRYAAINHIVKLLPGCSSDCLTLHSRSFIKYMNPKL